MSEIDYKINVSDETIMKYEWEIQIIELSLETDPKNKNLQKERLTLKVKQSNEKINNINLRQKLKESNQSEEPPQKKQKKIHTLNVQDSQEEDTNDYTYQDEQEEENEDNEEEEDDEHSEIPNDEEEEEKNENEDDGQEEEEDDEQDVIPNSKIQTRSMSINKEEQERIRMEEKKERIEQERLLQDHLNKEVKMKSPNKKRKVDEMEEENDEEKKVESQSGWSQARKNAFTQLNSNPNAYYYRLNAPGEEQKNGKWTPEEKRLFMQRVKMFSVGTTPKWGIFSITIPGRVGYQCSNFYRKLVKNGEIVDPNYKIDDAGKIHYYFKKK
jgi:hypothetical protein